MKEIINIEMIRIDSINILNPRYRNKKIFHDITENIIKVGLKRPITVKNGSTVFDKEYDLICGQGRLESFMACGQTHIPAIIVTVSEEDALVMSMIENLARRNHRSTDLMQGIKLLQQKGYDAEAIASKTGLNSEYAKAMIFLLEKGEERLIAAVEAGNLPINIAVNIASSPNEEQKVIEEAYESGELRGTKFLVVKKLLDRRKQFWRISHKSNPGNKNLGTISESEIMRVYKKELERKVLLIRNADKAKKELLFIVTSLRELFNEDIFYGILKTEGLLTLPKPIAMLLENK